MFLKGVANPAKPYKYGVLLDKHKKLRIEIGPSILTSERYTISLNAADSERTYDMIIRQSAELLIWLSVALSVLVMKCQRIEKGVAFFGNLFLRYTDLKKEQLFIRRI